jgi:hypothetical protein
MAEPPLTAHMARTVLTQRLRVVLSPCSERPGQSFPENLPSCERVIYRGSRGYRRGFPRQGSLGRPPGMKCGSRGRPPWRYSRRCLEASTKDIFEKLRRRSCPCPSSIEPPPEYPLLADIDLVGLHALCALLAW